MVVVETKVGDATVILALSRSRYNVSRCDTYYGRSDIESREAITASTIQRQCEATAPEHTSAYMHSHTVILHGKWRSIVALILWVMSPALRDALWCVISSSFWY